MEPENVMVSAIGGENAQIPVMNSSRSGGLTTIMSIPKETPENMEFSGLQN